MPNLINVYEDFDTANDRQSLQGTVNTGILNNGSPSNIYKPANGAYGFGDVNIAPPSAFNNANTYSDQGFGVDLIAAGNSTVHF
jgi:hypothetical protein